jgi:hypothetical protein
MDPAAKPDRVLRITGIAGSLRQGSFNRGLLRAAVELAPPTLHITVHDLLPIPVYNADVESQGVPEAVTALRDAVRTADGLLIATREYNHGVPGCSRTRSNTEKVQSKGNFDVFEEVFADDCVDHTPQPNMIPDKAGVCTALFVPPFPTSAPRSIGRPPTESW